MSARAGEDDLIARYFAPIAGPAGLGLKDDAACLTPRPGHDLVLTVDTVVEHVHFLPGDPPASVARKALGVNVSDLAAKGAAPSGFLLALSLPPDWTEDWLAAFAGGLGDAARDFHCPLLGGDTVRTHGPLSLSVTAIGEVPMGSMVLRTAAQADDLLFVTGTIGDATLGLGVHKGEAWASVLPDTDRTFLRDRFLNPQPRHLLAEAARLFARAGMDVSDGLVGDATKMLRASGMGGHIRSNDVPLSGPAERAIRLHPELFERALTGGDDYELLLSVPPIHRNAFKAAAAAAHVQVTCIGHVTALDSVVFSRDGRAMTFGKGSFSHF
jgi:thiamine-monophosphate kinase